MYPSLGMGKGKTKEKDEPDVVSALVYSGGI